MVKPDRSSYRKASQKGPRGGKTRTEQLRSKLRRRHRRLREKGLTPLKFHTKPIQLHVDTRGGTVNDYAVYGIYKDEQTNDWVLTGLAVTHQKEMPAADHPHGGSKMKVYGRYVHSGGHEGLHPTDGIEITRDDRKKDLMRYVSAGGSSMVEQGAYLVRPRHNPRTRREDLDSDAFTAFKRDAFRVYE